MTKVVGEDSARNALKAIEENAGITWLQKHLYQSYNPLLGLPWILDADVTVKTLYGHQEGAKVGYNPHKPWRPSHTYHTYMIANVHLILEVEVQAVQAEFIRLYSPWVIGITRPHSPSALAGLYSR
jgi:hypothetical protein